MDVIPFNSKHRLYLEGRNFDPDEINSIWDVQGTGVFGEYKNRLYIPITLNGALISYTTRDITDKRQDKYRTCHDEDEAYHHKFSLYGIDQAKNDVGLVVEGCTDVWRIGPGTVGTYGDKYMPAQVALLAKRFKRVFVLYDPDDAGTNAAPALTEQLDARNVDCEILYDDSGLDPGEMQPADAIALRKELGL